MQVALAALVALVSVAPDVDARPPDERSPWTVMIYGGVDSSAEGHIMPHLRSLASRSREEQNGEVLLLVDRAPGHSDDATTLGEDFEDTRLFRLSEGGWHRVSGGIAFPEITVQSEFEANSGDAHTLRKFIAFGKQRAPAERYALIVFGHGDCRSVCPDVTSPHPNRDEIDDPLYVAEITSAIDEAQSVDLLWFDVCSFGGIENAYELRPGTGRFSAAAMMATPPVSSPAPMAAILEDVGIVGRDVGNKTLPADGVAFGAVAIGLIEEQVKKAGLSAFDESWGCYDLAHAEDVKRAVDRLAAALAEGRYKKAAERIRGSGKKAPTMNYLHWKKGAERAWVVSPHFDLYDLAQRIQKDPDFSKEVQSRSGDVLEAVDRLVITSVGGLRYKGFEPGRNGLFILFPDGDASWQDNTHWSTFGWYHPLDRSDSRYAFGRYAWCADGATSANGVVENWFELMDCWFDTNDDDGGVNGYRW